MWTQPFQSVLLHLLLQASTLNLLFLPVRCGPIQTNVTSQPSKRHRIVARRSDFLDKLVMPIDLSILRSAPETQSESQQRPVLLALDLSPLHHSRIPEPRYGGNSVRNDILLIPDLTLPARIKNDYTQPPPRRISARVASLGNDRIPVFEHLHASYGQGLSPKDALWDFLEEGLEEEDNNLFPRDYEYPEEYTDSQEGMEDEEPYWYDPQKEEEYDGSDNKISSPRRFGRDKKNVFVSESWRPGGHVRSPQHLQEGFRNQGGRSTQEKNPGKPHRKDPATHATVFGLSSWRPGGKRSQAQLDTQISPMTSWNKKNLFFTKGWGPGGKPLHPGGKPLHAGGKPWMPEGKHLSNKDDTENTEEKDVTSQQKQPPWRRPKPMWGVPHLFGPYW